MMAAWLINCCVLFVAHSLDNFHTSNNRWGRSEDGGFPENKNGLLKDGALTVV